MQEEFHQVILVGAGPGGIAIASDLKKAGIKDFLMLEKGVVGQSWQDYPPETRLLSESSPTKDENQVGGISVTTVLPNIPHPSHAMYQRYLQTVVEKNQLPVQEHCSVNTVVVDSQTQEFILQTENEKTYRCQFLVWAAGSYSTPNESLSDKHCFIHYSRIQDWKHITDSVVTVIGGANGATEVVLQLASPGRKIRLLTTRFEIPLPVDCLWKENRVLVREFEKQGLVEIIEDFRVKSIQHDESQFIITSESGATLYSENKPIVCIGFLPSVGPIASLVTTRIEGHDTFIDLNDAHESAKQPRLFLAGTVGRLHSGEDGFIRHFSHYGETIVPKIKSYGEQSK